MNRPQSGFEQLVERHRSEILAYLMRLLGNVPDAQDVCQDTLLRAYRAFNRLAPDSNGRAWLYKIATRGAFNAIKQRTRRMARSASVDVDTLPAAALTTPDRRDEWRRVHRAVDALPPKQRAALMQRQFQGLDYEEIAACLGCTPEAARANVYQAIKKLRAWLAPERGE
jgi:RNA polymerase sigma-70 factor, ECF subfamily